MRSIDDRLAEHEAEMIKQVVAWAGSATTLAALLEVPTQTVLSWLARGRISARAAVKVEELSDGAFKARDLRPNVAVWWHEQRAKENGDA